MTDQALINGEDEHIEDLPEDDALQQTARLLHQSIRTQRANHPKQQTHALNTTKTYEKCEMMTIQNPNVITAKARMQSSRLSPFGGSDSLRFQLHVMSDIQIMKTKEVTP